MDVHNTGCDCIVGMANYVLLGTLLALVTALPFAWKWQLGMFRVGVTVVLFSLLAAVMVGAAARLLPITNAERAGLVGLLAIVMATGLLAFLFYRDPERTAPDRTDIVVSPADGVVIYVRRFQDGGAMPFATKNGRNYELVELTKTPLSTGDALDVGISLSLLDVHVNRAPWSGRVAFQRHFPGLFGSLRRPEMIFQNERATTLIENNGYQVAVVQIASRLVRQIAVFVREGQRVALGERMGAIRLGSQVDLVLPERKGLRVLVKPGDRVRAGESIIAVLEGWTASVSATGSE